MTERNARADAQDPRPAREEDGRDWLSCAQTKAALSRIDTGLYAVAAAESPLVRALVLHLIARGGKRLRPALVFLAGTYGAFDEPRLTRASMALELLHVASLYHDDIMDRAPLRRGVPSANGRWGNTVAAYAGTYLFARASALIASLGDLPNQMASAAATSLCTGQLRELEHAYDLGLTERAHLGIVARKTAMLFELPCRLGARLAGAPPAAERALARYGRRLGIAFQLADDALDLAGRAPQLGKATGADIREGVYSLAVLRTLRRRDSHGRRLRAILGQTHPSDADLGEALALVRRSGAVVDVLETARRQVHMAQAALAPLPDTPARRSLHRLADFAVSRPA